jgi:hypothetical protein
MKTKITIITFVAAIAIAAAWHSTQSKAEVDLSYLTLANVEALAGDEDGGGVLCYNSITTGESMLILYCGTCTFIPGKKAGITGTGKCN